MSENTKKTAVVYRTKYGSAKRYAQWIAEEVKADLFDGKHVTINDLLKYDTIVYGGSMYAVGILGIDLIKSNFGQLKSKKVIVFSVGASPAYPQAIQAVKERNFTGEMKDKVHFFHVRGAFDYKGLNPIDKLMMFLLKKKIQLKKPEQRENDEIGMLASYARPTDWTDKKSIQPIVDCIWND